MRHGGVDDPIAGPCHEFSPAEEQGAVRGRERWKTEPIISFWHEVGAPWSLFTSKYKLSAGLSIVRHYTGVPWKTEHRI